MFVSYMYSSTTDASQRGDPDENLTAQSIRGSSHESSPISTPPFLNTTSPLPTSIPLILSIPLPVVRAPEGRGIRPSSAGIPLGFARFMLCSRENIGRPVAEPEVMSVLETAEGGREDDVIAEELAVGLARRE